SGALLSSHHEERSDLMQQLCNSDLRSANRQMPTVIGYRTLTLESDCDEAPDRIAGPSCFSKWSHATRVELGRYDRIGFSLGHRLLQERSEVSSSCVGPRPAHHRALALASRWEAPRPSPAWSTLV